MMATQKKKPLPAQHRKVEPLTRKAEAAAPPQLQLEVLHERMSQMATKVETNAIITQMNKLHGETMERMSQMATRDELNATNAQMYKLHCEVMERMGQMATKAEMSAIIEQMNKLHGEAMARMYELHLTAMERIGRVETRVGKTESDIKFIKWIGSTLGAAIVAGLVKLIFFPVV